MNWYLKVLKQYADFDGRARRTEYWMYTLFNSIIGGIIVAGIIMQVTGFVILFYIYQLFVIIPSLAVAVRRLHDIGKSGWNYLFSLIPLVGTILLLVWFCTDSQSGPNKWGENPKEEKDRNEIKTMGK